MSLQISFKVTADVQLVLFTLNIKSPFLKKKKALTFFPNLIQIILAETHS